MKKFLSVLLSLCLALGIIFTATACDLPGGDDNNNNNGSKNNNQYEETDGLDFNMNYGKTYAMPSSLTFTTPTAESSTVNEGITLVATVMPSNATNNLVDWTLGWKNPLSSFANGKNVANYVTVTPSFNGSRNVLIVCLAPFGEKIELTVTSRDNTAVKATCTMDYVRRITSMGMSLSASGMGDNAVSFSTGTSPVIRFFPEANDGDGEMRIPTLVPAYSSAYTITDTFTALVELKLSDAVFEKNWAFLCTPGGEIIDVTNGFFPGKLNFARLFWDFSFGSTGTMRLSEAFKHFGFNDNPSATFPAFEFVVTMTGAYSTFTVTYSASIDASSFNVAVTHIILDDSLIL